MPKAPTAQHTLDAVAPVQDCARRNRFHHHRSSLPHCFLSDYNMGNGACWYNDLHHIPTMLAYLPSALYTKCTDMSSVGLPGRKMVLFYCSEAIKRPGAQRNDLRLTVWQEYIKHSLGKTAWVPVYEFFTDEHIRHGFFCALLPPEQV